MKEELLRLAERCEKATEGEARVLLIEAAEATLLAQGHDPDTEEAMGWLYRFEVLIEAAAYLDAAMTLIDPDVFFHLSRFSPGEGPANAHVYPNRCLGDDYEGNAATPALALCAAALRASVKEQNNGG